MARAALWLGVLWMLAGLGLFVWLVATVHDFLGTGAILGLFVLVCGLVTGAVQAMVAPRISERHPSVLTLQAWATGLGILLSLMAWPIIAIFASNWLLVGPFGLVVLQGILHSKVDVKP